MQTVESTLMVSDAQRASLLAAVRRSTADAEQLRRQANEASARRREAVREAMDAGVSRQEIADAAGVHRNVLYQIAKRP